MTQEINIFKYWKKIRLCRKNISGDFFAHFLPFFAQNPAENAIFQKSEDVTCSKNFPETMTTSLFLLGTKEYIFLFSKNQFCKEL